MCVPDLRGTHGTFSYYTNSEKPGSTTDGDVGGDVIRVEQSGDAVRSFVRGPAHPLRRDRRVTATHGGGASGIMPALYPLTGHAL